MPRFDELSESQRSAIMARIRKKDTKPELLVRRIVHAMGYRFRLHRNDLPGTPDIVLAGKRKVIQVNGCFWHRHDCSLGRKTPRANLDYWLPKLERNAARDRQNNIELIALGWDVLTVWECETKKHLVALQTKIHNYLQIGASATPVLPHAENNGPLPPKVPVPKPSTGRLRNSPAKTRSGPKPEASPTGSSRTPSGR